MPNRDGTGPQGNGKRRNTSGCRGNQRPLPNCQNRNINRKQPNQIQNSSGVSNTAKSIGMALLGLVTALLPLASKLDKLLSLNNRKKIQGPEQETKELEAPTPILLIPEKADKGKTESHDSNLEL